MLSCCASACNSATDFCLSSEISTEGTCCASAGRRARRRRGARPRASCGCILVGWIGLILPIDNLHVKRVDGRTPAAPGGVEDYAPRHPRGGGRPRGAGAPGALARAPESARPLEGGVVLGRRGPAPTRPRPPDGGGPPAALAPARGALRGDDRLLTRGWRRAGRCLVSVAGFRLPRRLHRGGAVFCRRGPGRVEAPPSGLDVRRAAARHPPGP